MVSGRRESIFLGLTHVLNVTLSNFPVLFYNPMPNPFTYQSLKDDKLQIFWHGKPVMLIKGKAALKLTGKLQGADEQETQLILAKVTGNFKRGNERQAPKGQ